MTGVKKKTYLLLHRSGAVVQTKTLTTQEPIEGITAIINLETLEQYVEDEWEKIPKGYKTLIAAEEELCEEEEGYEDEEDEKDEEELVHVMQTGARRYFSPQVVWAYATHFEKD